MAKQQGSVWVEGGHLHYVVAGAGEWRFLGVLVSAQPTAELGSCWVEGIDLHYVDANGDERLIHGAITGHTDAAASGGSGWVDATFINWITSGQQYRDHDDVHGDTPQHNDDHIDTGHTDHGDGHVNHDDLGGFVNVGHVNSPHDDVPHVNTHTNVGHGDDAHVDDPQHDDSGHSDHGDGHVDNHVNHDDLGGFVNTHQDQPIFVE